MNLEGREGGSFSFRGFGTRVLGFGTRSGHGVFARHALGRFLALGDLFVRASGMAFCFVSLGV